MLIALGLLSLIITMVILVAGVVMLSSKKKVAVVAKAGNNDPKTQNEQPDFWHYLGFIDDTPNLVRVIVAGKEESGPILRYIGNVEGKVINRKVGKIEPAPKTNPQDPDRDSNQGESWFNQIILSAFGKRWIGLPFLRSVKPIYVDRVVRKDTSEKEGKKNKLSEELRSAKVKRYGLYGRLIRPTYHHAVDTKDNVRFNVVSNAIIEVVDALPGFTIYNDSLLQTASDIISAFISSEVLGLEWEEYKSMGEGKEKFEDRLDELNRRLTPLGLHVNQLFMSEPEISDEAKAMQEALEETRIAKEKANAKRAEGEGKKDYAVSLATGDALGIERVAKAKRARVEELVTYYISQGVPSAEAVDKANAMVAAEFNAEAVGKLTGTYVSGNAGVQLAVPTGGNKS